METTRTPTSVCPSHHQPNVRETIRLDPMLVDPQILLVEADGLCLYDQAMLAELIKKEYNNGKHLNMFGVLLEIQMVLAEANMRVEPRYQMTLTRGITPVLSITVPIEHQCSPNEQMLLFMGKQDPGTPTRRRLLLTKYQAT